METINASRILAALGHETRLTIFRLLIEAGPDGVNASAIGEQLDMAPATLSFHLSHLSRIGLICGTRESRFIHYAADFEIMDQLIVFLTRNCCQGKVCLPGASKAGVPNKRRNSGADRRPSRRQS
jgi:ArsR family transcriptional regulator